MARWKLVGAVVVATLGGCTTRWEMTDLDGDGYTPDQGDCWDAVEGPPGTGLAGADISPGAVEGWYDGVDQDCAGDSDFDQDGDGWVPEAWADQAGDLPVGDCDDTAAAVSPQAEDGWYDGVDSDCEGNDDYDQDGDGYVSDEHAGLPTDHVEGSGGLPGGDCDDELDSVHPGAEDTWYDGVDSDCAGNDDYDQDGDGYVSDEYAGLATDDVAGSGSLPAGDCDDTSASRYPDGSVPVTWYNGVDERCDGNDGDQDGDGYWIADYQARVEAAGGTPLPIPAGMDGDCFDDDESAGGDQRPDHDDPDNPWVSLYGHDELAAVEVHPGAADRVYDGVDADCAGDADFDKDGDGAASDCLPARDGSVGLDCLDSDDPADCGDPNPAGLEAIAVYPGATEQWYDGTDQDCGDNDDYDADTDFYAALGYDALSSLPATDCDDTDEAVNVDAVETWYDGVDSDCDERSDYDADFDGVDALTGGGSDCDDSDASVHPGAGDAWYDGVDSDCSGGSDYDRDGDGDDSDAYGGGDCDDGDPDVSSLAAETWYDGFDSDCDGWSDYDADLDGDDSDAYGGTDCDDTDAATHFGATETWYDGVDADCAEDDDYDADADGYRPVPWGVDCDDGDPEAYPGATETWYDGVDADCDGASDHDADGDGAELGVDDCDDSDATINPDASETWYDGVDQDCDGWSDYDADLDGDDAEAYGGTDCDDTDAGIASTASETWYDGIDADCDDWSDYDADYDGQDADAYGGTDCDDTDDTTYYGATETWYDGVDADCDDHSDYDADYDGDDSEHYGGGDCDDSDPDRSSLETEIDNALDDDCDGLVDEDFVTVGDVIITEVMVDPYGSEPGGEWIELYNPGSSRRFLDGWIIGESMGGEAGHAIEGELYVEAGEYLVLCSDATAASAPSTCDYDYDTLDLDDSDSGDLVIALDGSTIDSVSLSPSSHHYSDGVATQLDLDWYGYSGSEHWCAATELFTATSYGTPGSDNTADCGGGGDTGGADTGGADTGR